MTVRKASELEMSDSETDVTPADLRSDIARLEDLFRRRLLEDRRHRHRTEHLEQQLTATTAMATGASLLPLVHPLLQVIDRLEARSEDPPASVEDALAFLDSVRGELLEALLRNGVAPIAADGSFDPTIHEAVDRRADLADADGRAADDLVVDEVIRQGYALGTRVIRPARVTVRRAAPTGAVGPDDAGSG